MFQVHLKLLVVLMLLNSLGCSTLQGFLFPESVSKDTKVSWEKDLRIQVDDRIYYGMALVPRKKKYNIYIFPPNEEISRLQWRTCHRGGAAKDAVQNGKWPWSKKQKYFKLEFEPMPVELERACTLSFEALAKSNKVMGFAMVVFPDSRPWYDLPLSMECNGSIQSFVGGTSICQAPVGAITRVDFGPTGKFFQDETPDLKCPPLKSKGNNVYEFKMPKDECVFSFKAGEEHSSGNLRSHKIITFGFEKSPPQED